jgi:hypothetical protein
VSRKRIFSRENLALLFAVCVFSVHAWAIFRILNEVPAWLLRLDIWDMAGAAAYTMVFALLESVGFFSVVLILGVILPIPSFRRRFVSQASMFVLLTSVWAILAHLFGDRIWYDNAELYRWLALYMASVVVLHLLIDRMGRLAAAIHSFAERLVVVSGIYLALDLASILLFVLRNVVEM